MPIELMMYAVGGVFLLVFIVVVVGIFRGKGKGGGSRGGRSSNSDFDNNWSGGGD